jgi:hypothetical protein
VLSVPLAPELCDAQEALQEVEKKRRKEDLAVEESVKEVLAWAQVHRPKNTTKNLSAKAEGVKGEFPLFNSFPIQFSPILFILLFISCSSTANLFYEYLQAWCIPAI